MSFTSQINKNDLTCAEIAKVNFRCLDCCAGLAVMILGCVAWSGALTAIAAGASILSLSAINMIATLFFDRKKFGEEKWRFGVLVIPAVFIIMAALTLAGYVSPVILGQVVVGVSLAAFAIVMLIGCYIGCCDQSSISLG